MAIAQKRQRWIKWSRDEEIKFGPGPEKIKEFVLLFLKKKTQDPMKFIATFGNTRMPYRSISVCITEMKLKADGGLVDIFGETYVPEYPAFNGKKFRILDYDPHRRFANALELFE